MLSENVISEKAFSDHVRRGVLVPDQKKSFSEAADSYGNSFV